MSSCYHQGMETTSSGRPSPVPPVTERAAWKALDAHALRVRGRHLRELFASDPARGERFALEAAGIYFDYSKHRVVDETMALLVRLAEESGLRSRIDAMFRGDRINVTEGRAVLHVALRAPPARPSSWTARTSSRACTPCSTGWPRSPIGCAAASGPGIPGANPRRRQHRHRRIGPRPGDGLRGAEAYSRRDLKFRFVSNIDGTDFSKPFATSTRPRRCSSSRRRRSPRSRR